MDALAELVHQKPLEHVFVAEIVHLSGYSKSGFYDTFTGKYDLSDRLIQYETDMIIDFLLSYAHHNRQKHEQEAYATQVRFFEHVQRHRVRYETLLDSRLSSMLLDDWCMRIIERCVLAFQAGSILKTPSDTDINMYLFARLHTVFSLIRYWRRADYSYTPVYMAEQCRRLS